MNGTRADRLERLLQVQARKRQIEEWRLGELKREGVALVENSIAILKSLGDQSLLHGLFLDAKASTLRRNDVAAAANLDKQVAVAERLREAQGVEKRLERAARDERAIETRDRAGEDLDNILDDFLASTSASFK